MEYNFVYQVIVKRCYASECFGDFEDIYAASHFAQTIVKKRMSIDGDGDDINPITDVLIRVILVKEDTESEVTENEN